MNLKTIITILLFIFSSEVIFAQCVNNVSTDPNNAINNSLPDVGNTVPYNYDQRYLNGFNWWATATYPLTNMQYNVGQPYDYMLNIQSTAYGSDYSYLIDSPLIGVEKMLPQNGWELLLVNLGRYPDDVTVIGEITYRQTPYLVFYNRYKGIMRVFVRYGNNEPPSTAVNGVKINLEYLGAQNNNLSGIFRLASGVDKPLNQTSSVSAIGTLAPKPGQSILWFSGDLQIAYDPCVCYYPTNLKLSFEFFSTTDFKLKGRGISIDQSIVDGNGDVVNQDFLSGVDFSSGSADNGFIIYKNLEKLVDDYIEELDTFKVNLDAVGVYNEEVEKKLAIIKVFKVVVSLGLTAATGSPEMTTLALKAPSLVFGTDSDSEAHRKAFFKAVEKILGEKLNTYISENFEKKPNPEKPIMPTASFSEMNFEGQFYTVTPIQGPLFSTPGSFVNNDNPNNILNEPTGQNVYGYPIYNEALGQFALLITPKLLILNTKEDSLKYLEYSHLGPWLGGDDVNFYFLNNTWTNVLQFKIIDDLDYYFNPVLDYNNVDIQASLNLDLIITSDTIETLDSNFYSNSSTFKANIQSLYFNVEQDEPLFFDTLSITTPFVPIDAFNSQIGSFGIYNRFVKLLTETAATNNLNNSLPKGYYVQVKSAQLKLLVDMEFETLRDDGAPNATTEIFTYDIDLVDDVTYQNNLIVSAVNIPNIDYSMYPLNSYFGTTNFGGQQVDNCTLDYNTYTCAALNDITINGDITVVNGFHVDFKAGNEINVIGESNISPEAVLQIEPIYDYSNPMPPVSDSYVSDFCNGLGDSPYLANSQSKRLIDIQNTLNEDEEVNNNTLIQNIDFTIFPNPTTNSTTVVVNNIRNENLTIKLMDVSGKQINVNIEQQNSNSYVLDVNHLERGIYFITVSTFGGSKTKRLVVQ